MAWTSPQTWTSGQVVTASDLNTHLRDNLSYLFSGRPQFSIVYEGVADKTVTGITWTDVDAANLKSPALAIKSGRFLCFASCRLQADNTAGSSAQLDVIMDSTTRKGGTSGLVKLTQNTNNWVSVAALFTGIVDTVTHDFKLQFRNGTVGATTQIYGNAWPINFSGFEV